jgi:hypothetical protein
MISRILKDTVNIIKGNDFSEVYTAFDGVDIENKSKNLFVVVMAENLNAKDLSVVKNNIMYDFTSCIRIICLCSKETDPCQIYDFIQNKIVARLLDSENKAIYKSFEILKPEIDYKIRKIKIETKFYLCGNYAVSQ